MANQIQFFPIKPSKFTIETPSDMYNPYYEIFTRMSQIIGQRRCYGKCAKCKLVIKYGVDCLTLVFEKFKQIWYEEDVPPEKAIEKTIEWVLNELETEEEIEEPLIFLGSPVQCFILGIYLPYNEDQVRLISLESLDGYKVEHLTSFYDGVNQYHVYKIPIPFGYDEYFTLKLTVEHYNPEKDDYEVDEFYIIYNEGFANVVGISKHWHLLIEFAILYVSGGHFVTKKISEIFENKFTIPILPAEIVKIANKLI